MSDGPTSYPPPGAAYPPPGAPSAPAPAPGPGHATVPPVVPGAWPRPPAGPTPPPGLMLGAAHKPGAFPLRPLTLGMMWDGAFRIIRFNPRATVGAAVLVTAVAMLVPVLVTAALTFTSGLSLDTLLEDEPDAGQVVGLVVAFASLIVSLVMAQVGVVLVTGMVAHVTRAAAVGRRLDLGEAWTATRGRRWRLIGLALLTNLAVLLAVGVYIALWVVVVALSPGALPVVAWGVVSIPAFLALLCWAWTRLAYLPVPALMLEEVGVLGALARSWQLTRGAFWRTFGIGVLTLVVGSVAGSLISTPVSVGGNIVAAVAPDYAVLTLVVTQALSVVLQYAFYAPFVAAVASVQYVDLRIRAEAYDVELLREAGIVA